MKKKIILFLSFMFLFTNVSAASICSNEDKAKLNTLASQITASYSVEEGTLSSDECTPPAGATEDADFYCSYAYLKVVLLNLTDDFYVEIKNDKTDEVVKVDYSKTSDGMYSFEYDPTAVINYTFNIYASNTTGCSGQLIKPIYLTLPKFNEFSGYDICEEASDNYYCQPFVTIDNITYDDFVNNVEKKIVEANETENTNETKEEETKKNNYTIYYVAGGFVIVLTIAIIFIIIRRRHEKEIL